MAFTSVRLDRNNWRRDRVAVAPWIRGENQIHIVGETGRDGSLADDFASGH